jgi:ketosteroid isomerase-like protein
MHQDLNAPHSRDVDAPCTVACVDVVRSYLDAARRGDWNSAFGFFAEDMLVRIPGRSSFAGEHRGSQAAIDYIQSVRERYREGTIALEVIDMLASDERVALLVQERFTRRGSTLVIRRANVYRVREGQIVELSIFEGDQYLVDELLH